MSLDILCEVKFSAKDNAALDRAATLLGKSREDIVREAVRLYAAQCVPTHKRTPDAK